MELAQLVNERAFRKCKGPEGATTEQQLEAFEHFCSNYVFIKHPERGRIKFELRDAQRETVCVWISKRYSVALKARQIGFSTLAASYSLWLAFFQPDRFIVMLSRTEREAIKLLLKTKYAYKFLPQWMKERGPGLTNDNQLKMTFANESAIESLPSGNDPARGESVYLVIVDEWAFLPNPEEAWASIEPIADVGGRVIGLSTANGSGTFFHELYVGAEIGTNLFAPIFFPWSAGDRDQAWYDAKKKSMPGWQLHQEYPSSPEEAFIKSGNPVFDIDKLLEFSVVAPARGYFRWESEAPKSGRFVESDEGEFRVWKFPDPHGTYVLGADVSYGLSYGDYSVACVIDARDREVVAVWHGHIDPDLFGELCAEIGWWYGGCLAAIEVNNHGLTTIKAMQRRKYRNLYKQRRMAATTEDQSDQMGWRTTVASKPLAIDELAAAIREGAVGLHDQGTIGELKTYVRDEKGKTHGSPHDDRVMALAICWQMLKWVWLSEYRPKQAAPKYSLGWWGKMLEGGDLASKRGPIGAYSVRK